MSHQSPSKLVNMTKHVCPFVKARSNPMYKFYEKEAFSDMFNIQSEGLYFKT